MRILAVVVIALFAITGCKIVEEESGGNGKTVPTYRIANSEIQGWSEENDSWKPFTKATMNEYVNGDAPVFVNGGINEGAEQVLINASSDPVQKLTVWILDFGSSASASQMFQQLKSIRVTTPVVLSGFTESVAIATKSGEGCTAYAVFDKYVLRLSFEFYSDPDLSLTDASLFLKLYQKR